MEDKKAGKVFINLIIRVVLGVIVGASLAAGVLASEESSFFLDRIYPAEGDTVSGLVEFSVEVMNDHIKQVVFVLTTDNESQMYLLPQPKNTNGMWTAKYDTATIPEGKYQYVILLVDDAGTVLEYSTRFSVDTIAPKVNTMNFTSFAGEEFRIEANITDAVTGVSNATATIYSYTCEAQTHNVTITWCDEESCEACESAGDCKSSCYAGEEGIFSCLEQVASLCRDEDCRAAEEDACYYSYCATYPGGAEVRLYSEPICLPETPCDNRTYSEYPIDTFFLTQEDGDLWKGMSDGLVLESGVRYRAIITPVDAKGNQGRGSRDAYSRPRYIVTAEASKSGNVSVTGTVTASDGSSVDGSVLVMPGNVSAPVVLTQYLAEIPDNSSKNITVMYRPNEVCEETFTSTVQVVHAEEKIVREDVSNNVSEVYEDNEYHVSNNISAIHTYWLWLAIFLGGLLLMFVPIVKK